MISLIIIIGIWFIAELSLIVTYGFYLNDEDHLHIVKEYKKNLRLNQFNPKIISGIRNLSFISTLPLQTFCKYYINGLGPIPRWSKMHKIIKDYYKELYQNL